MQGRARTCSFGGATLSEEVGGCPVKNSTGFWPGGHYSWRWSSREQVCTLGAQARPYIFYMPLASRNVSARHDCLHAPFTYRPHTATHQHPSTTGATMNRQLNTLCQVRRDEFISSKMGHSSGSTSVCSRASQCNRQRMGEPEARPHLLGRASGAQPSNRLVHGLCVHGGRDGVRGRSAQHAVYATWYGTCSLTPALE